MSKVWLAACLCALEMQPSHAGSATPNTRINENGTTVVADATTDFLSDDGWRQLPRTERQRYFQRSLLAKLEPTGQPALEKLSLYVERYKDAVVFDGRLVVFSVRAVVNDFRHRKISLEGEVSVTQYKSGLASALEALGFDLVRNDIVVLPCASSGNKSFGVATTVTAAMRREPRERAEQVNSIALGWPVRVLRSARPDDLTTGATRGTFRAPRSFSNSVNAEPRESAKSDFDVSQWLLVQSAEGYIGFVRREGIKFMSEYRLPDAMLLVPTTATLANGSVLLLPTATGLRKAPDGRWSIDLASEQLQLQLPMNHVSSTRATFTSSMILELAQPLLGTKYVWGGVTNFGIDCSGFTQFIYRCKGLHLPRDAEEQAIVGMIVGFGPQVVPNLRAGDLVFFVNERGKVSHVAISLDGEKIIHSSQRDVHLDSLTSVREDGEAPLAERILYARRVVGW
ncbi:MAG: C40 family peptidase [Candidatus Sumerlaeaceae bacterium]